MRPGAAGQVKPAGTLRTFVFKVHLERLVKHKGRGTCFFTENVLAKARVERWQQETLRLAGSISVWPSLLDVVSWLRSQELELDKSV